MSINLVVIHSLVASISSMSRPIIIQQTILSRNFTQLGTIRCDDDDDDFTFADDEDFEE